MALKKKNKGLNKDIQKSEKPMGFKVIVNEVVNDKFALISFFILCILILGIIIASFFLDVKEVMTVDIFNSYARPGEAGYIMGADKGGRDLLGQLILGAYNSVQIGVLVTLLTTAIGVTVGLIIGYYGGVVDNVIMRIIDFLQVLPVTMIIIVLVTIIPRYNKWKFVLIMSAFYWTGIARLVRSKSLSEGRKDYISASKTMGTSPIKIMFGEILPNISSIIIVDSTLALAANIGIETGLTFLGFGLPPSQPSLGTLIAYARDPEVIADKLYIWVPAVLLVLVFTLSINYVGQALRRASDAKQRRV
ncbi:MAG: ABC transporter permease [Lagierella massiliensis]|nr:ABC transporter permease [Lagierella massiliensis]